MFFFKSVHACMRRHGVRALVLAAAVSTGAGAAAQVVTVDGVQYEAVQWPVTGTPSTALSLGGSWGTLGGGGTVTAASSSTRSFALDASDPATEQVHFDNAVFGARAVSGLQNFRIDTGQNEDHGDTVATYTLGGARKPTEILYYVGAVPPPGPGNPNGMKFARWAWASPDAGTTFTLLAASASVQATDSGTGQLAWRTFGSLNNQAVALVRIANPAGISGFSITANRLDVLGAPFAYPAAIQRSDYSPTALLVGPTFVTAVGSVAAVPATGFWALLLMGAGVGWLTRRRWRG
ncbi:MAG: hypothetical protein Q4G71_09345 [Pseudomonadota bacterium]|nr:hypothetical protein [Pseudomonadota bacterium]